MKEAPKWLTAPARLALDAARVSALALLAGSSAAAALASGLAVALPPDALKLFASLCKAVVQLPRPLF